MWEDSQLQNLDISRAELSPDKSSIIEALRTHSYRDNLQSLELLLNEISNFDHFQSLKGRNDGDTLLRECLDKLQYEFIPRGRFLFHCGDVGEKLYFIVSGVASVLVPIPQPEIFKQEQSYQLRTHWCGQIDRPELSGYERELAKSNYQRARKAIINFQDKYNHPRLYKMLQESPPEEKKAIMTRYFQKTNQTLGLFRQAVELHENSSFGEASLIGQRLRTASVFAVQDLHLFSIKGRFYMDIFNPSQVLNLNFVLKNLEKTFTSLTKKQLINLSYLFERVPTLYNLNQVIFKDGQDRNYIYLIRSGSVAFKSVRGISLGIISEGEFFGCENKKANAFRVLLSDKHCFNAQCSATNTYLYRLDCHLLESEEFEPALLEFAEMGNKKADYYARRAQHCQNIFQQIDLQVSSPGSSFSGIHDELAKQNLGDTDLPATGSLQKSLNAQTSVRSLMSKIQIQKKFLKFAREDSSKENSKEERKQQFNIPEIAENISIGSGNDFTGQFDEQQQQYIPQRSEFQLGDGSNGNNNLQSSPRFAYPALKGSGLNIKASQHRVSASNEVKSSLNDLQNPQAQSISNPPHPSTFSMIPGSSATLEQIDLAQPTSIIYPQQNQPIQPQQQQSQPQQILLSHQYSLAQLRSDQELSSEYLSQQSDGHLQFQFISKKDFNKTKDTLIKEHDKLKQRKPQTYLPQEISELPLSKIIAKKLAPMIHLDSQNKMQEITPQNGMSQEQKRYLKQSTSSQLAQQAAADPGANVNGNTTNTNYNSHTTPQHQVFSQSLHANQGSAQNLMNYQTSAQFHKPNTACIRIMNMAAKSREKNNLAQKDKSISVLSPSISFLPISGTASSRRRQQVPLLSFGQLQQTQDQQLQLELGSLSAKDYQKHQPGGFTLLNQQLAMTARQKSNERSSSGMNIQSQFQQDQQDFQSRKETTSREKEPQAEEPHQINGETTTTNIFHNNISNINSLQTLQPKRLLGTAPSIQRILDQSQRKSEKLIRSTHYIVQGDSPGIDHENISPREQIASTCGVSHPCYSARTSIQNSGEKSNKNNIVVASRLNLSSIQTTNNQNHVVPGKLPLSYTCYQASKAFTPIGSALTATTNGGFSCSTVSGFATAINNGSSVFGWNSTATSGGYSTVTDRKPGALLLAKTDIGTPIDNTKPSLTPRMDRFSSTIGNQRSKRYQYPSQSPTDNEDSTQRPNNSRNQNNYKTNIFNSSLKKNPLYQTLQRRSNESKQLQKKTNMLPFFIADKADQYKFIQTPSRSLSPTIDIGQNVIEILNSGKETPENRNNSCNNNKKPTTATTCSVKKRQKMISSRNLSIESQNQQLQQQYPSILVIDKYSEMKPSTAMTPNNTNNLLDTVISYPNQIKIDEEFNFNKISFPHHEFMYDEQKGSKSIFQHRIAKI